MRSIAQALALRLLLGGAALLAGAGALLHWQVSRALTSEIDASLRGPALELTSLTEQHHGRIDLENEDNRLLQYDTPDGLDIYLLRTVDGREISRSKSLGSVSLPSRESSPGAPEIFDFRLEGRGLFRCASVRFTPRSEDEEHHEKSRGPLVDATLIVGRSCQNRDRSLAILDASLAVVAVCSAAGLLALVNWSVRSGLKPLALLGEKVESLDAASLSARLPVDHLPGELRPIVQRLNELLARLEGAFDRERRFTSTAAHELRTPLAELRAAVEVNLKAVGSPQERKESWQDVHTAALRLESLALRLLELARSDDPAHALQRESVRLSTAVREAWAPTADQAAQRNVGLENSIPEDWEIQSDPTIVAVILGNLCANAAFHGSEGAPLRVSAERFENSIALYFRNCAPGLEAVDLPHLFERFWRKEASRSDSRRHGLGLALAAKFAEWLGGSLTARLDGNELEFTLTLPDSGHT